LTAYFVTEYGGILKIGSVFLLLFLRKERQDRKEAEGKGEGGWMDGERERERERERENMNEHAPYSRHGAGFLARIFSLPWMISL
jgi:hypothetical protein